MATKTRKAKNTKNTAAEKVVTKKIVEGQRVYNAFPWAGPGIVYAIHGQQKPQTCKKLARGAIVYGGSATFDVVFESGICSKQVPESVVRGVQWEILDEVATPAEIEKALKYAMKCEREKQQAAQAEAEAEAKERAELPGQYPQLRTAEQEPKASRWALGAKNLRTLLKQAFPEIKFSVTSESYSGGYSIRIRWIDGPSEKAVEILADKFQECDFDSMQDLEVYRRAVWPEVFGGAKYVSCARSLSPAFVTEVARDLGYTVTVGKHGVIEGVDVPTEQYIHREARQRSAGESTPARPEPKPESEALPAGVTFTEYKGHPVIQIPLNGKTFGFGLNKAKAIVAHFAAIEQFVAQSQTAGRKES
jgi:hypothetical protein